MGERRLAYRMPQDLLQRNRPKQYIESVRVHYVA